MTAWRPIETAPKDGTTILVFDPEGVVADGPYDANEDWVIHIFPAIFDGRDWLSPVGECSFGPSSDPSHDRNAVLAQPSHWMPMPEAPE